MKAKEYIKYFDNHEEYLDYRFSSDFIEPNVSHCVAENDVHYNKLIDYSSEYFSFIAIEDGTFKMVTESPEEPPTYYSLDNGETWVELANNTNTPIISAGQKIMWKATLPSENDNGIGHFIPTGKFVVEGNIMSLLFGDDFQDKTDLTGYGTAFFTFFGGEHLISAKNLILPATTLSVGCYLRMFEDCENLVAAPELPATTLARHCYQSMFRGCTSLTTAPELLATTLADECYSGMFYGCTSLTTAPSILPAATLTNGCYEGMFEGCTSLTTAPELPAPKASVAGCYYAMFSGCSSLNYIKCLATEVDRDTQNWVVGVAPTGTFVKAAGMSDWTIGVDGIPEGWIVEEEIVPDDTYFLTSYVSDGENPTQIYNFYMNSITEILYEGVNIKDETTGSSMTCRGCYDFGVQGQVTLKIKIADNEGKGLYPDFSESDIYKCAVKEGTKALYGSFGMCEKLSVVLLPSTIETIEGAFGGCKNLRILNMPNVVTPPTIDENAFDSVENESFRIRVPEESLEAYKTAPNWSKYADKIVSHV